MTRRFPEAEAVAVDAAYKISAIVKKSLDSIKSMRLSAVRLAGTAAAPARAERAAVPVLDHGSDRKSCGGQNDDTDNDSRHRKFLRSDVTLGGLMDLDILGLGTDKQIDQASQQK